MLKGISELPAGIPKQILLSALAEIADVNILLALVAAYASDGRNYDHQLGSALRRVSVEDRPSEEWSNATEAHGVEVAALRRQLFEMLIVCGKDAELASACLIKLDRLRDRMGRLDAEPRHPHIESGRAWPFQAEDI
jgi:hypothetical protein